MQPQYEANQSLIRWEFSRDCAAKKQFGFFLDICPLQIFCSGQMPSAQATPRSLCIEFRRQFFPASMPIIRAGLDPWWRQLQRASYGQLCR